MIESCVCYLVRENQVLFLHRTKKENDANQGKWIGIGGKLEALETPEQAMKREVLEESGYTVLEYEWKGRIDFNSDIYPQERIYVYLVTSFSGQEIPCEEGDLQWVDLDRIQSLELWPGDRYFLAHLFEASSPFFHYVMQYDQENKLKEVRLVHE